MERGKEGGRGGSRCLVRMHVWIICCVAPCLLFFPLSPSLPPSLPPPTASLPTVEEQAILLTLRPAVPPTTTNSSSSSTSNTISTSSSCRGDTCRGRLLPVGAEGGREGGREGGLDTASSQ